MDIRLRPGWFAGPAGGRSAAFAALVVVVVLAHLWLTRELAARMSEIEAAAAMPARIQVAYVRTLEPEAPKPVAPIATAPPPEPRAPRAPRRVARAASAVEPPAVAEPVPEPVVEAASEPEPQPVAAAASAADAEPTSVAAADAAASTPAAAPGAEAFVWPTATKVSYLLNGYWRGDLNGGAEVEWIRIDDRYQVNVDLHAGPEFAPLFSRRMTSEGRIGEGGLVPERYDEDTQVMFRDRRRVSVLFAPESIVLGNGQQRDPLAGVQDTASQFIQFTWMFGSQPERLRVGNSFEFPLALPRSLNRWTYDVAEEETLYTPFATLATFHLKPRRAVRRPGEWLVEMWFAPELRFLPVRIHIEQDAGTFVDLLIAKKPEISGP
ncbi:MAG: DUF3108 domain-containing protein [Caldimonas sp.]